MVAHTPARKPRGGGCGWSVQNDLQHWPALSHGLWKIILHESPEPLTQKIHLDNKDPFITP